MGIETRTSLRGEATPSRVPAARIELAYNHCGTRTDVSVLRCCYCLRVTCGRQVNGNSDRSNSLEQPLPLWSLVGKSRNPKRTDVVRHTHHGPIQLNIGLLLTLRWVTSFLRDSVRLRTVQTISSSQWDAQYIVVEPSPVTGARLLIVHSHFFSSVHARTFVPRCSEVD